MKVLIVFSVFFYYAMSTIAAGKWLYKDNEYPSTGLFLVCILLGWFFFPFMLGELIYSIFRKLKNYKIKYYDKQRNY